MRLHVLLAGLSWPAACLLMSAATAWWHVLCQRLQGALLHHAPSIPVTLQALCLAFCYLSSMRAVATSHQAIAACVGCAYAAAPCFVQCIVAVRYLGTPRTVVLLMVGRSLCAALHSGAQQQHVAADCAVGVVTNWLHGQAGGYLAALVAQGSLYVHVPCSWRPSHRVLGTEQGGCDQQLRALVGAT